MSHFLLMINYRSGVFDLDDINLKLMIVINHSYYIGYILTHRTITLKNMTIIQCVANSNRFRQKF